MILSLDVIKIFIVLAPSFASRFINFFYVGPPKEDIFPEHLLDIRSFLFRTNYCLYNCVESYLLLDLIHHMQLSNAESNE